MTQLIRFVVVLMIFGTFNIASAGTLSFHYTGKNYTSVGNAWAEEAAFGEWTTSMGISGHFSIDMADLGAPILSKDISADVISFSLFDGINTYTASDSSYGFAIKVDANRNIVDWYMLASKSLSANMIATLESYPDQDDAEFVSSSEDAYNTAINSSNLGEWVTVPVPSSIALLSTLLLTAGSCVWLQRRRSW